MMDFTCTQHMLLTASRSSRELNDESRWQIQNFILSRQDDNGGFQDRSGQSDLYYTLFGLAGLISLGVTAEVDLLQDFLHDCGTKDWDFVHLASLIRSSASLPFLPLAKQALQLAQKNNFISRLAAGTFQQFQSGPNKPTRQQLVRLEEYRSGDGGYHHAIKNAEQGSVYAAFMAWLAYQDAGATIPNPEGLCKSLQKLQLADGSFVNEAAINSGSTTTTAAAVVLFAELGEKIPEATLACLLDRTVPSGGFLAGPNAPLPDLLSTATALYALRRMEHDCSDMREQNQDFVTSLWNDDGGFSGHALDEISDCEYTFYALLALGSLE